MIDQKDSSHVSPLTPHVNNEDEINLLDYYNVLRKKKWLIIIPTLVIAIIAGAYSFFSPPVWEVHTIIKPSKYGDPKQIAVQINESAYDSSIAAELKLDIREIPTLKAETLKDTALVKVSTQENNTEKAIHILLSLVNNIKREFDKKIEIEIKEIDSNIKSKVIENLRIEEEIKAYKNELNIVKQRKKEIEIEINDISKGVKELRTEQRLMLKKEYRGESESLAMLLYSNTIQQSLVYLNTLTELLNSKKTQENNISLSIKNTEKKMQQLENEIDNLHAGKGRIEYTELIKKPTASLFPVAPKKKRLVLIAGILGLMSFTMIAFFIEFIAKQQTSR